jgi:hypothetical protein
MRESQPEHQLLAKREARILVTELVGRIPTRRAQRWAIPCSAISTRNSTTMTRKRKS